MSENDTHSTGWQFADSTTPDGVPAPPPGQAPRPEQVSPQGPAWQADAPGRSRRPSPEQARAPRRKRPSPEPPEPPRQYTEQIQPAQPEQVQYEQVQHEQQHRGPDPFSAPPYRSRQGLAAEPSARGKGVAQGQVRAVQQRTETDGQNGSAVVLTFRLERYDDAGDRLRPIPVQVRAPAFDGALSEGDQVQVFGTWKDGTLHSKRIVNLTTGATVKAQSMAKGLIVFLAIVAVMIAVFGGIWAYSERSFQDRQSESRQWFCEQAAESGSTPPGC